MSGSGVGKILTQGILDNGIQPGLVGGTPKPPALSVPNSTPKVMPIINQDSIKKARAGVLQSLQARSGRASTLLTSPINTDKFGG